MPKDLRTFIQLAEKNPSGGVRRVKREVSPDFELCGILRQLQNRGELPIVIFEKVKGSDIPLVVNLIADDPKLALALEVPERDLVKTYIEREANPIPPKQVKDGPVKEQVFTGKDVDLFSLPMTLQCEKDGGSFITAGVTVVRDPDTGAYNSGIYRQMRHERNILGMSFEPQSHIGYCYRKMEVQGKGLPAVTYLGHHPAVLLGSQSRLPFGGDEMAVMGGLMQEPLELVPCETQDLMVPAYAEIAIEGIIRPHERRWEGPFGEYTWYYGFARNSPVFEITAITHRKNPYYQDLFSVFPEHLLAGRVGREAVLFQKVRSSCPSVTDVALPLSGVCRLTAYVQIKKQFDGESKMAALAALASDAFVKLVVVVDEDVDVHKEDEVMWAVATRTQPDQDTFFVPNSVGSRLDPSGYSVWNRNERNGMNTKWAIDATRPIEAPFEEVADVPKRILNGIDLGDYFDDLKEAH